MKDLLASPKDSSPVREKAGLSFSTMKSLVLREEKFASEFGADEKVLSLIKSLLDAGKLNLTNILKVFAPRLIFHF